MKIFSHHYIFVFPFFSEISPKNENVVMGKNLHFWSNIKKLLWYDLLDHLGPDKSHLEFGEAIISWNLKFYFDFKSSYTAVYNLSFTYLFDILQFVVCLLRLFEVLKTKY